MSKEEKVSVPLLGSWSVKAVKTEDESKVVYEERGPNVVVKTGKADVLQLVFAISGSSAIIALGAGASSTAATVDNTNLVYEHILNASRKVLTNTTDGGLTVSDIQDETITIDSCTYHKKITVRGKFTGASDGNVGHPFQEYGLFTTLALPSTPTGTSGVMFNRYVATTPITLTSDLTLIVETLIRI